MTQTRSESDSRSPSPYSMNGPVHSNIEREDNLNYANIINLDNYRSAQKLSELVSMIFNNQLVPVSTLLNNTNRTTVNTIHESLNILEYLVDNKASAQDMMMLVHVKIHPALQAAYNLKLKQ
jgi:hypothetical protein